MPPIIDLVKSKKFWMTVIGTLAACWAAAHPASYEHYTSLIIAGMAAVYVAAQGIADHGKYAAASKAESDRAMYASAMLSRSKSESVTKTV